MLENRQVYQKAVDLGRVAGLTETFPAATPSSSTN